MREYVLNVPAIPVAQPRQRVAVIAGRAHNYTPTKHPVNAFKAAVQAAWSQMCCGTPIEGAVQVGMVFVLPRPKNKIWKTRPMPREYRKSGRGDWDNFSKAVCDSLNKLAWRDDAQISNVQVQIVLAAGGEQPHVEVQIREIEP